MAPEELSISIERWLQRIEDKQGTLDGAIKIGLAQIQEQISALEKSLPDRFLTRREWDVVLEAGQINREAQIALTKATNERHQAEMTDLNTRVRGLEGHGWWIAGSLGLAFVSLVTTLLGHSLPVLSPK